MRKLYQWILQWFRPERAHLHLRMERKLPADIRSLVSAEAVYLRSHGVEVCEVPLQETVPLPTAADPEIEAKLTVQEPQS